MEALASGNTNYTGSKGSESLTNKLDVISKQLEGFHIPEAVNDKESQRLQNAVTSLKVLRHAHACFSYLCARVCVCVCVHRCV